MGSGLKYSIFLPPIYERSRMERTLGVKSRFMFFILNGRIGF